MRTVYLNKFLSVHSGTEFDPATGTGGEFTKQRKSGAGLCKEIDDGWVAIYPDPDEDLMLVQINGTIWPLSSPDTELIYYHEYDSTKTHFEIRTGDNRFETTYDAWWKDVRHFEPNKAAEGATENLTRSLLAYSEPSLLSSD